MGRVTAKSNTRRWSGSLRVSEEKIFLLFILSHLSTARIRMSQLLIQTTANNSNTPQVAGPSPDFYITLRSTLTGLTIIASVRNRCAPCRAGRFRLHLIRLWAWRSVLSAVDRLG